MEKQDASGKLLEDIAICLYDKFSFTRQWLVLLQGGTIVRVRDTGDGFVVAVDEE